VRENPEQLAARKRLLERRLKDFWRLEAQGEVSEEARKIRRAIKRIDRRMKKRVREELRA